MYHAGRLSVVLGAASWIAVACALVFGGLSPTVSQTWVLRTLSGGALVAALAAAVLGFLALLRGPQRISGAIGFMISATFILLFSGAVLSLVR